MTTRLRYNEAERGASTWPAGGEQGWAVEAPTRELEGGWSQAEGGQEDNLAWATQQRRSPGAGRAMWRGGEVT